MKWHEYSKYEDKYYDDQKSSFTFYECGKLLLQNFDLVFINTVTMMGKVFLCTCHDCGKQLL